MSLFKVHRLNETGMQKAKQLATAFENMLTIIEGYGQEGRSLSIARTKLEEACFFAKKSLAERLENQQIEAVPTPGPSPSSSIRGEART